MSDILAAGLEVCEVVGKEGKRREKKLKFKSQSCTRFRRVAGIHNDKRTHPPFT